jgi:hypothetical protein
MAASLVIVLGSVFCDGELAQREDYNRRSISQALSNVSSFLAKQNRNTGGGDCL